MLILPAYDGISKALEILRSGGVVAHATETCYGFACDMTNPKAVQKLFTLKHRPSDMPVSALFASTEEAKKYVEWNALAEDLATKYLPGPLTLILSPAENPPQKIFVVPPYSDPLTLPLSPRERAHRIGIRISSHPLAHRLAKEFGNPISTTSANLHGQPNPYSIDQIPPCDLILDSGPLPEVPPSRVIDCTEKEPKVLRH